MDHDAALTLRKGDYVMHKDTTPSRRPIRITQVEMSLSGKFVMLRFASLGSCWVPATEYARPRPEWKGDMRGAAWYVTRKDKDKDGETVRDYIPDEEVRARYREEMADD